MSPSEIEKVTCPTHGAVWSFPSRSYLCHCLMPYWMWRQRMDDAECHVELPQSEVKS